MNWVGEKTPPLLFHLLRDSLPAAYGTGTCYYLLHDRRTRVTVTSRSSRVGAFFSADKTIRFILLSMSIQFQIRQLVDAGIRSSSGTSIFANQLDVITGQIRRHHWDAFDQWNEDQSYAFVFSFLSMIHPAKKVDDFLRQVLFFSFKSYPPRKQKWYLLRSLLSPWSKKSSRIYRKSPNSLTFNNDSDLSRSCSMVRKTSDRICRNQYRSRRSY